MANSGAPRLLSLASLRRRFPALARLGGGGLREIPFIAQTTETDCGAACLSMVLASFGSHVPLDEVRKICATDRSGTDAEALVRAARWFGMRARAVRLELEGLQLAPRGAILHWEFRHFVVFDRITARGVAIIDPASGPRVVPLEDLSKSFTGVAVFLDPSEKLVRREGRTGRYQRYVAALWAHRALLGHITASSILLRLLALATPVLTGVLVDRVIGRGDYELFTALIAGAGGVLVFQLSTTLVRAHLSLSMRTQVEASLTLGFIDHLVRLPLEYFERRSTGDLMVRMGSHARIRDIVTGATLSALLDGTLASLYVVALMVGNPRLAWAALALGGCRVLLMVTVRRRNRQLVRETLEAQSKATHHQMELLAGIETLKSSGSEDVAAEQWSNLYVDSLNVAIRTGRLAAVTESLTSLLDAMAPLAIITLGALEVMARHISLGEMLALNSLALGILGPLGSLVSSLTDLQLLGGYLDRIDDVFDTKPEQSGMEVRPAPPLDGRIAVEDVWFRYGPNAPNVLEAVSLEVQPGQCIAIVGRSGSGKSTLGRLLLGLYVPTSGRILYDGIDLTTLLLQTVRHQFGVVTQNARLFSGSIRSNIAGGHPGCSLEEIVRAAKLAEIHDDIMALPLGFETPLTNAGSALSGGQRQRVALARALIRVPSVLLLDEATSALDPLTERRIYGNLEQLRCTRIIVAHRLSTIVNADRIVVLEAGKVVEVGTHQQLLDASGHYAQLVRSQTHADGSIAAAAPHISAAPRT